MPVSRMPMEMLLRLSFLHGNRDGGFTRGLQRQLGCLYGQHTILIHGGSDGLGIHILKSYTIKTLLVISNAIHNQRMQTGTTETVGPTTFEDHKFLKNEYLECENAYVRVYNEKIALVLGQPRTKKKKLITTFTVSWRCGG